MLEFDLGLCNLDDEIESLDECMPDADGSGTFCPILDLISKVEMPRYTPSHPLPRAHCDSLDVAKTHWHQLLAGRRLPSGALRKPNATRCAYPGIAA